ncbi:MAG: multiheme c-type cytochrome [Terracidiphilus sp.]
MKRFLNIAAIVMVLLVVFIASSIAGASWYYSSPHGDGCARCHEMASTVSAMQASPHRNVPCMDCHEASIATKLRHIRVHLVGNWSESIRLRDVDVVEMVPDCQKCHQNEYATWHAGPHSASYSQIFTNPVQNSKQRLMDDCLRCHGMHFDGSVRDLVQPQNLQGPWHLVPKGLADQPAMPCQTCHWIHREGVLASRPKERISVAGAAVYDSLAFYDRREGMHFAAAALPIPQLHNGARLVKMSQDARQAICYQCHAPREPDTGTLAATHAWGPQVGSGDDRTPIGVHEGLSCISCHNGHNMNVRASCKTCHPQMSDCGLDVEKMDTTYANAKSLHNIHWVQCSDCHQRGIPKMKTSAMLKRDDTTK